MKKFALVFALVVALILVSSGFTSTTPTESITIFSYSDCPSYIKVIDGKGYYLLTEINSEEIREYFDYLHEHKIIHAVVEIHSFGGSVWDAQRIVGLMQYWQGRGVKIETRVSGIAFSAGFYIFISGDTRLVSKNAYLMWHELQAGIRDILTPTKMKFEADTLRFIQDTLTRYVASRGKISFEELSMRIAYREYWMTGEGAVLLGFADGYL